MKTIQIQTEYIKLAQFLKFINVVSSGGDAKQLIQDGAVSVNGEVTTQRGKKLKPGDEIIIGNESYRITT
jgi:ribosome-associated protein